MGENLNIHVQRIQSVSDVGPGTYFTEYSFDEDYDIIVPYSDQNKPRIFLYNTANGHAAIREIIVNGLIGIGPETWHTAWSAGWTSVATYKQLGRTYLFLLKAKGDGNDGNNMHIHRLHWFGVGKKIDADHWSGGWTTAKPFTVGGKPFMFLLKKSGYSWDDKNVHIHRIKLNGKLSGKTFAMEWGEGWMQAEFHGRYLMLKNSKLSVNGSMDFHIHKMTNAGNVGPRTDATHFGGMIYPWFAPFCTNQGRYFLIKSNLAGDVPNYYIFELKSQGQIEFPLYSYSWPEGQKYISATYFRTPGPMATRYIFWVAKTEN